MSNHPPYSEAQRLLVMRRGLCTLDNFRTASSKCADKLAIAMEKALGVLFPYGPRGGLGFQWVLDVATEGAMQSVWIDLHFHRDNEGWLVALEDLHAALSLWMYTARADEDHPWLCTDVPEPSMKALGGGTTTSEVT